MRWRLPHLCTAGCGVLCLVLASWSVAAAAEPAATPSAAATAKPDGQVNDPEGILNLDLEQLGKVDVVAPALSMAVSTVERSESTVGRTPAAVFVVTNEMIRRSGVQTIPDALRLVPGVQVMQDSANRWSVTIRGLNWDIYADKLLVQVDGRSAYSSFFGGVFWDVQDLVFEDIERIEVIRGPGATVWGANAVNGVINIITKSSKDTQGGYFQGGFGTEQRGFSTARYGGKLDDNTTYRLYGKWFDRGAGWSDNEPACDDWRQARTGFRIDSTPNRDDLFTLQGDYYNGYDGNESSVPLPSPPFSQTAIQDTHVSGGNVLGRWTHTLDTDSDWRLQWYYDNAQRHDTVISQVWDYEMADLDFQHRFPLLEHQELIWGLGYHFYHDNLQNAYGLEFDPSSRVLNVMSCFVQDQIALREDLLYFTVGSKFEHDDYTGIQIQPTARLLWTPDKTHCLWGAISRAVQTPSRLYRDGLVRADRGYLGPFPVFSEIIGNSSVGASDEMAYELGMRAQPTKAFNWDLAVFFNQYEHLTGGTPGDPYMGFTPTGYPAVFYPADINTILPGQTYGFELAAGYQFTQRWNLRGAYTFLRQHFGSIPENGTECLYSEGANSRNQYYLWLAGDLGQHWFLDVIGRYADVVPDQNLPSYFVGDIRLAYRPRPTLEYAVVGRNLLEGVHYESTNSSSTGVQQEVYGAVTCRF